MADVFLSYKREDQQIAREVAADLEAEGFSVFFDVNIDVGDSWDERIERELNAAKACVVLWSPKSRDSKWVRREAREAMARGILCPAMIARCKVPIEFSDVQAAGLIGRRAGDRANGEWRRLCEGVGRSVGRKARGAEAAAPTPSTSRPMHSTPPLDSEATAVSNASALSRRALVTGGAAVLGAAAIGGGYYGWTRVRAAALQQAWEEARAAGTRQALNAFIRAHPQAPQIADARVLLTDLPVTAREVAALRHGGRDSILGAKFNPDSSEIATWGIDPNVRIWQTRDGRPIATLPNHTGAVNSVDFHPTGRRVITAAGDSVARVWSISDGRQLAVIEGHRGPISEASYSSNGEYILTLSRSTGVSPDNDGDGTARVWRASDYQQVALFEYVENASFSPDGEKIVTCFDGREAQLRATDSGAILGRINSPDESPIYWSKFSLDGQRLATFGRESAQLWDISDAAQPRFQRMLEPRAIYPAFNRDRTRVVGTLNGNLAGVWDANSGAQLVVLSGHSEVVDDAQFDPQGGRVVTASRDRTARVWNASTGALIATLATAESLDKASFSGDGRYVVTKPWWNGAARIWEVDE